MIAHYQQIFWSLSVFWGMSGIVWPVNRLRLWRKSVHLYLSFLAFTDETAPPEQLRRAMICGILSAVYDYDSDWEQGSRKGANFKALLHQFVEDPKTRELAEQLFANDVAGELSEDALERGSVALYFYQSVIDSVWMRRYTREEIYQFGRLLQIVDDLFDLQKDHVSGDWNCLLLVDKAQGFADEAREFLDSDFFLRLEQNSRVYRVIGRTSRKALDRFGGSSATWRQLWKTGRPKTAGLYGLVLSVAGFGFVNEAPWALRILVGLSCACLTLSINSWNDLVDRFHDQKKGKFFASAHANELRVYWRKLNLVTGAFLTLVAVHDLWTAVFFLIVWLLGLLYSLIPRVYLVQNLLVSLCGGALALGGMVYHRTVNTASLCTFGLFTGIVLLGECYKDIEDARIDKGYKATMPVFVGHVPTVLATFGLIFIPTTFMVCHPHLWIRVMALVAMPALMFAQATMFINRTYVTRVLRTMQIVVTCTLLTLLIV